MAALFVRRERWTLSWTGLLVVVVFLACMAVLIGRPLCAFLSVSELVNGRYLVIESWIPPYAHREGVALFSRGAYDKILVTGMVDEDFEASNECFVDKSLTRFGAPEDKVVDLKFDKVEHDRTFRSALAVKRWLEEEGVGDASVDVISIGPHARRSRLLFEEALGARAKVGVFAVQDRNFDPAHWWRSSAGVRTVIGEAIAYLYSRLFVMTR
jgi:hypothetical protein